MRAPAHKNSEKILVDTIRVSVCKSSVNHFDVPLKLDKITVETYGKRADALFIHCFSFQAEILNQHSLTPSILKLFEGWKYVHWCRVTQQQVTMMLKRFSIYPIINNNSVEYE